MKTNYILLAISTILLFIISCERLDETLDFQSSNNVSGEWHVVAYIDNTPVSKAFSLDVSNSTQYGVDSITISEIGNDFWSFSVNTAFDPIRGSFQSDLSYCQTSDDELVGVKVNNGQIIDSDSIFFEMKFEDDIKPFSTTYQIKGHRVK